MGYNLQASCPKCKGSNFKLNNYCIFCGTPFREELTPKSVFSTTRVQGRVNCPACQVANPSVAKFCCFCGKGLTIAEVVKQ